MKRLILLSLIALVSIVASAQGSGERKVKVYCQLQCVGYNLFKEDLNVRADFGLASKAEDSKGWIYNSGNNKKLSFASQMSVLNYFGARGWTFVEKFVVPREDNKNLTDVYYILEKEVPSGFTDKDVLEDIDFRVK